MEKTNRVITECIEKHSETLLGNKLFENIGKDRLEAALLFYDAKVCEYKKGEFLHNAGDSMKCFGLVLLGCVQALSDDIEGNRMIMANVTEGSSFGEALCYLQIPDSSVYIQASTDSVILWMSGKNLKGISDGDLSNILKNNFMVLLSIRTLQMNRRIQILSKLTIREKIMTFLSETYGTSDYVDTSDLASGRIICVPMNREDMAAYIGTNRSALSRELAAMKAEGIIDYHKNEFVIL